MRARSIKTVHFVSPTIWAWRGGRIHKIKRAAQLVLCLYPFEPAYYAREKIPALFVGHPLADDISLRNDSLKARQKITQEYSLGSLQRRYIALLPGSRVSELQQHTRVFIRSALYCLKSKPDLQFLIATTSRQHQEYIKKILEEENAPPDKIHIIRNRSHKVMAAADAVLLASGTASLECLLVKRPMVVAYKVSWLSYWIFKKMIRVPYISQPNWLFNGPLVEEYIQGEVRVEKLAPALLRILESPSRQLYREYMKIHKVLRKNAAVRAAKAVNSLLRKDYAIH